MRRKQLGAVVLLVGIIGIGGWVIDRSRGGISVDKRLAAETTLKSLRTQVELWQKRNGRYPTNEEGLGVLVKPSADRQLDAIPVDPWTKSYQYLCPGEIDPRSFDLYSLGPDGVESEDDIFPML